MSISRDWVNGLLLEIFISAHLIVFSHHSSFEGPFKNFLWSLSFLFQIPLSSSLIVFQIWRGFAILLLFGKGFIDRDRVKCTFVQSQLSASLLGWLVLSWSCSRLGSSQARETRRTNRFYLTRSAVMPAETFFLHLVCVHATCKDTWCTQ